LKLKFGRYHWGIVAVALLTLVAQTRPLPIAPGTKL
jgi:hypothetical protein